MGSPCGDGSWSSGCDTDRGCFKIVGLTYPRYPDPALLVVPVIGARTRR